MRSAIQWVEAAVSGKLARADQDIALQRAVLRNGSGTVGSSKLPAGLSAALRSRPGALASWHVVPVKATRSPNALERAVEGLNEVDLPAHVAVAESGSTLSRPPRQEYSSAAVGRSRGRKATSDVVARLLSKPSAASVSAISSPSSSAASTSPAMAEHEAAEPLARSVPVNAPMVAGKDAALVRAAKTSYSPTALQRVIPDENKGGLASALASTSPLKANPQSSSARLLGSAVKTSEVAANDVSSKGESSSPSPTFEVMKSISPEANVRSQIRLPIVTSQPAIAAIGSVTRPSSYDQAIPGHEVVPRRAVRLGSNAAVTQAAASLQAAGMTGSASLVSQRDHLSQYQLPSNRPPDHADPSAGQGGQVGMMVALRGDVVMDGRKMGRLVATGQASSASLPTLSGSAINLRAMPIFAGTGAPL